MRSSRAPREIPARFTLTEVDGLRPPPWLPTDHPYVDTQPTLGRTYGRDGTPIGGSWPEQAAVLYEQAAQCRLRHASLYRAGVAIAVMTDLVGVDGNTAAPGRPVLPWETMILVGGGRRVRRWLGLRWRYATEGAARAGHAAIVAAIRAEQARRRSRR
jgi:hypothetical protein